MDAILAETLLRSIIDAEAAFMEAADALNAGIIDHARYQRAADRFHGAIDLAASMLPRDIFFTNVA